MAQMNARMNPGMQMNGPNNTGSKPMPPAQQQQQQPPINSIKPNGPLSHGGKPGQGGGQPNQNVLDAVKKVQEEAQRQSQPPGPLMPGNQRMPISSPPIMNSNMPGVPNQQWQQGQQAQRFPQPQQHQNMQP